MNRKHISKGEYKPDGYNSVSPYLIVDGAHKLIDLLKIVFNAKELRRYDLPDGKIMHSEIRIDDSVIMLADSSDRYPPNNTLLHLYVPDVHTAFNKVVEAGFEIIERPNNKDNDPDTRGTLKDFQGNSWSVSTQN